MRTTLEIGLLFFKMSYMINYRVIADQYHNRHHIKFKSLNKQSHQAIIKTTHQTIYYLIHPTHTVNVNHP